MGSGRSGDPPSLVGFWLEELISLVPMPCHSPGIRRLRQKEVFKTLATERKTDLTLVLGSKKNFF